MPCRWQVVTFDERHDLFAGQESMKRPAEESAKDSEEATSQAGGSSSVPDEYVRLNRAGLIVDESWGAATLLGSSRRSLTGIPLSQLAEIRCLVAGAVLSALPERLLDGEEAGDPQLELHLPAGSKLKVTRVALHRQSGRLDAVTVWLAAAQPDRVEFSDDVHLLDMAARMSKVGGWELVKASQRVRWTAQTFRLHELEVGDAPSLSDALNFYLEQDRAVLSDAIEQALTHGTPFDLELKMLTARGNLRYTRSLGRPVFVDGEVVSIQGTFQDVTEERETQLALQESEARYRDIFENNNAIKLIIDPKSGRIVQANSAAVNFYGHPSEVLTEMKISDINMDPPHIVNEKLQAVRNNLLSELEFRHRLASGEVRDVKVHTGAVRVNGQTLVHSIIFDITERKRAERYVQRMQHLESLGRLAGGIAHDFNNVLTIIFGNLSLAQLGLARDSRASEFLASAEHAIGRAKGLSRQLLTFAKGGAPICRSVSLKQLVTDVTGFDLSGSNVRRELLFDTPLDDVHVDPTQLEQVISNLTLNADEAMPDGGTLTIRAWNRQVRSENAGELRPGRYVELTMQDEGCGIERENLQQIFEPYFSTKPNGSGLGLATCYSIINRHQGDLKVDSTVGVGTVFTLLLPAVTATAAPAAPPSSPVVTASTRLSRVLVLDDERMILDVVSRTLAEDGIVVDAFERTDDAVAGFRRAFESGQKYDVVLLDLTIPGEPGEPGGREAVARILEIDPDACAICSSGYADDRVMANFQEYGFRGVVAKPYVAEELRRLVQSFHDQA
ncbi:MAG: PAS domain S-box protein [Planctomycetaceae bacterium]|nr:PAS domain S-box protein [Planctomycetaceae bacterium]